MSSSLQATSIGTPSMVNLIKRRFLLHFALMGVALVSQLAAQTSKISADLTQLLTNPLGSVKAIIQFNNAASINVLNIELLGGIVNRQYSLIPAVSVTLPNVAVTALAALPTVQYISLDRTVGSLNDYT